MSDRLPVRYFLEVLGFRGPVGRLEGHEAVSAPFRFEATLRLEADQAIDPDEAIKTGASIVIASEDGQHRRIDGVVTEARVRATLSGAPDVRLVIEPRLALLRHRSDLRVFRDQTVPEIVNDLLSTFGIRVELRLSGSYPRRAYTVQLRESDLDFVHRLLEDEGIFYFFLPGDTVVLGDSPASLEALAAPRTIFFHAGAGLEKPGEVVTAFEERAAMTVGSVTLRDWTPDRPASALSATRAVPDREGPEFYDYPGEFSETAQGERRAALMAEAFASSSFAFTGKSTSMRLFPGAAFDLADAPLEEADLSLMITRIEHRFDRVGAPFLIDFQAVPGDRPFRPARVTPAPVVPNPMTGVITGPPGEDIHTDAMGRVKVRFFWDRRQAEDDQCSDWIPLVQDNTGHSCNIPRVGWEVLVHFLEGDPDRPVVLGRLYNGSDPFPEVLPAGKTFSALRSLSSPGRAGTNMVRMNDAAGAEEVMIHAERDQTVAVANDKRADVGTDESRAIAGNETIAITNLNTALIGADIDSFVGGNQSVNIAADRNMSVGGQDASSYEKDHHLTIGVSHTRRLALPDSVSAKDLGETVGALILEASVKENSSSAQLSAAFLVGGAAVEIARKNRSESTQVARAEAVGGLLLSSSGAGTSLQAKKDRVTTAGAGLVATAAGEVDIGAPTVEIASASSASFEGPTVLTLVVGSSQVMMGEGLLLIEASKVSVEVQGSADLDAGEAAAC